MISDAVLNEVTSLGLGDLRELKLLVEAALDSKMLEACMKWTKGTLVKFVNDGQVRDGIVTCPNWKTVSVRDAAGNVYKLAPNELMYAGLK